MAFKPQYDVYINMQNLILDVIAPKKRTSAGKREMRIPTGQQDSKMTMVKEEKQMKTTKADKRKSLHNTSVGSQDGESQQSQSNKNSFRRNKT